MTVYELIQELVQEDAGKEIVLNFKTKDIDVEVEEGQVEGDKITVDGEEKTSTDISINTYSFERHRKVHIECEED